MGKRERVRSRKQEKNKSNKLQYRPSSKVQTLLPVCCTPAIAFAAIIFAASLLQRLLTSLLAVSCSLLY
jgi:hypothetical protein